MPFTPFHFGPGAVIHAVAPRHVSFIAFVAANVLIDVEPAYYMLTGQDPLHRFLYTYVGATVVAVATVLLFLLARTVTLSVPLPNLLRWKELNLGQVIAGAAAGAYSHIVLDSVMHADIRPWAPFSQANPLNRLVSIDGLQDCCIAAGAVAAVILAGRQLLRRWRRG